MPLISLIFSFILLSSCESVDNSKRYKGITRVVKKIKGKDKENQDPKDKHSNKHSSSSSSPPSP